MKTRFKDFTYILIMTQRLKFNLTVTEILTTEYRYRMIELQYKNVSYLYGLTTSDYQ